MHRRIRYSRISGFVSGKEELTNEVEEYATVTWETGLHLHFQDTVGRSQPLGIVHISVEDSCWERLAVGTSKSAAPWVPPSYRSEVLSQ